MGGQAKYKTMWVDFVPGIELVVFVVDCADRERLNQAVESFWDVVIFYSNLISILSVIGILGGVFPSCANRLC